MLRSSEELAAGIRLPLGGTADGDEMACDQTSGVVRLAVAAIRAAALERASLGGEVQRLRRLAATLHRQCRRRKRQLIELRRSERQLRDALEQRSREMEMAVENGAALVRKLTAELDQQRRARDAEVGQLRALLDALRRERDAKRLGWLDPTARDVGPERSTQASTAPSGAAAS